MRADGTRHHETPADRQTRHHLRALSPGAITVATFAVFDIPALIQFASSNVVLGVFRSVSLESPWLAAAVLISLSALFVFFVRGIPPLRLGLRPIRVADSIYGLLLLGYCAMFALAFWALSNATALPKTVGEIISAHSLLAVGAALLAYGIRFAYHSGNILAYYAVLTFTPLFFLYVHQNAERPLVRVSATVMLAASSVLLFLIGRREALILTMLAAFLIRYNRRPIRSAQWFGFISLATVFLLGMLLIRLGVRKGSWLSFFESQEFSPFVYGTWLVQAHPDWIPTDWLTSLTPAFVLLGQPALGAATRRVFFSYYEYGPTVSIFYPLVTFFPISVILLAGIIAFVKGVWAAFVDERTGPQDDPSRHTLICIGYAFVALKFAILLRNGEIGYFFWDVIFAGVLFAPLIVFRPARTMDRTPWPLDENARTSVHDG